ncbi:SDR family NAD(P)-dependent oxidoreductase [Massilia sp. Mn16-1_5]|uniref:SDR family NAD(P)-dependent oxidoreductase n=1 Tax=Massilia sp. Mn16-1_5 TaxID=2079199 RepID=UPI001E37A351|nr:SDR family NAD(P)-dependent oxidoreductase [Massilia sp. Mn16-1_5]
MSTPLKKIVIIGATSSMAEHCARLWVAQGAAALTLVGRDRARTESVAADLRVRGSQASVAVETVDFEDARAIASLAAGLATSGPIDLVLIAHGSLPDQPSCQRDLDACASALSVNGVSPVLFAEAFAAAFDAAGRGTLVLIGSVAGDRGRRSNYVYGAAKGLVTRYAQGLQHRFAGTAIKVVLVKPGPTDTPMTSHLKQQGTRMATPEEVAHLIVDGAAHGKPVVYAPKKWALIMMIIRHLPSVVFNKMNI